MHPADSIYWGAKRVAQVSPLGAQAREEACACAAKAPTAQGVTVSQPSNSQRNKKLTRHENCHAAPRARQRTHAHSALSPIRLGVRSRGWLGRTPSRDSARARSCAPSPPPGAPRATLPARHGAASPRPPPPPSPSAPPPWCPGAPLVVFPAAVALQLPFCGVGRVEECASDHVTTAYVPAPCLRPRPARRRAAPPFSRAR